MRPLYQSETSTITSPCRDARSVRPLYQMLQHHGCYPSRLVRQRTHRPCVPTKGYTSCCTTTDAIPLDTIRASLRRATRLVVLQRTHRPCVPTTGYTFRCTATDAQTVRPYRSRLRASLHESSPCAPTIVIRWGQGRRRGAGRGRARR